MDKKLPERPDCFKTVKLSHFLNPSRFWFYDLDRSDLIQELRKRELKDFPAYENRRNLTGCKPKQGDFVAYKSEQSKKWVRCVVDDVITAQKKAVLWALDYGKPLSTSRPEKLLKIEVEEHPLIVSAGLNVLPAEEHFNEQTKKIEMVVTESWSEDALNLFEKLVSTYRNTSFKKSEDILDADIAFGEIIVEKDGKKFNIGSELVRQKLAVQIPAQKFLRSFNSTASAVIERWDDNLKRGGVLNAPDFIEVGSVASSGFQNHPFLFKCLEKRAEQGLVTAEMEIVNSLSVSKVDQWLKKNTNIKPEESGTITLSIDQLILNEGRPSTFIPPTSRSRSNSDEKSGSSRKPSQSTSDGQQTSTPESVPSAADEADGAKSLSFDSFLEKKRLEKTEGGLLGFMKQMKRPLLNKKRENWMSLDEGEVYPVQISAFEGVNRFYVQVVDDEDGWSDLMCKLDNFKCLELLENPQVGMLCLVERDQELHRAKIIRKSDFTTLCFCVDTGDLAYFQNELERVYQIPDSIIDHMPFQAVSCRLAGIKAPNDFSWTSIIYQKVVKRICQQRIRVVKEIEPEEDQSEMTGISRCYDVILLDLGPNNEDINVNELLVRNQLADPIKKTAAKAANKTF